MPRKSRKHSNRSKVVDLKEVSEISDVNNIAESICVQNNDCDMETCKSCENIISNAHDGQGNLVLYTEEEQTVNSIKSINNHQLTNGICDEDEHKELTLLTSLVINEKLTNGEQGTLSQETIAVDYINEVMPNNLSEVHSPINLKDNEEESSVFEGRLVDFPTLPSEVNNSLSEVYENTTNHLVNGMAENSEHLSEDDDVTKGKLNNSHANSSERDVNISTLPTSQCEHEQTNEIIVLKENLKNQLTEIARLKEENEQLRNGCVSCDTIPLAETTVEIYEVQMAALEKTITQLQKEVDHYRDKMTEQDEFTRSTIYTLKKDLSSKLEQMTKQYEACAKEKESMVVKYALSERSVLTAKKNYEELEKKFRETIREKETFLSKIRVLTNEKARLSQVIDVKTNEISTLQRDAEKAKEEVTSRDIKIKWAQNKLKTETDAHKETQSKLEKVEHKLKEAREESDQIRKDCQEMIRTYQESEEIKSNSLDMQLREKETELELERQEKVDQEEVYVVIKRELDGLKKKHKISVEENNALTRKVQTLERERLDYEENLSKLREQLNEGHQELADLNAKLAEVQNLATQIEREKEKVSQSWNEIERLRQANMELQIDMETCRRKEGELLEFTERLTSKNVTLVSDYNCLEAKYNEEVRGSNFTKKKLEELENKCSLLENQLSDEQQQRKMETQLLARKLAEKTKIVEMLNIKVEEHANENQVLKKKNSFTVRELTRELQALRRRFETYEIMRNGHQEGHSLGSRTSSTGSLDKLGLMNSALQSSGLVNKLNQNDSSALQESKCSASDLPVEPTRQVLIERIVKLQWAHARKNEKIEFLEEHVSQLLKEIQRKSKLIQNYIMREDTGTLATNSMDVNKVELARKGGIMSSLYLSQANDERMTLELSLEICRKLQAVLEDTLLKNITLKENIKILGDEIERLTKEHKQLR